MGRLIEGGGEGRPAGKNLQILDLHRLASLNLSFLLVDISTSFGEVLYANVSFLRNRKFDLISQSGWIVTTQLRKL